MTATLRNTGSRGSANKPEKRRRTPRKLNETALALKEETRVLGLAIARLAKQHEGSVANKLREAYNAFCAEVNGRKLAHLLPRGLLLASAAWDRIKYKQGQDNLEAWLRIYSDLAQAKQALYKLSAEVQSAVTERSIFASTYQDILALQQDKASAALFQEVEDRCSCINNLFADLSKTFQIA